MLVESMQSGNFSYLRNEGRLHHCRPSLCDVQILTIQFYTNTPPPEFFCHNPNRAGPIKRIRIISSFRLPAIMQGRIGLYYRPAKSLWTGLSRFIDADGPAVFPAIEIVVFSL